MDVVCGPADGGEHFRIGFVAGDERGEAVVGERGMVGEQGIKCTVEFMLKFVLGRCAVEIVPVGARRGFRRFCAGAQQIFFGQKFLKAAVGHTVNSEAEVEQRAENRKRPS